MYSTEIGLEYKYDLTSEKFKTAFEFLRRKDLAQLPEGWIELDHGVRASVQHYTTIARNEGSFETHEKYFDVQYVVEGRELCGVCRRQGLVVKTPYDEKGDITFYEDPEYCGEVLLLEGDYILLAPEDAHKPRLEAGGRIPVKKIVLKVPVEG